MVGIIEFEIWVRCVCCRSDPIDLTGLIDLSAPDGVECGVRGVEWGGVSAQYTQPSYCTHTVLILLSLGCHKALTVLSQWCRSVVTVLILCSRLLPSLSFSPLCCLLSSSCPTIIPLHIFFALLMSSPLLSSFFFSSPQSLLVNPCVFLDALSPLLYQS